MSGVSESTVKAAALDRLGGLGWSTAYGPGIALGAGAAERDDHAEAFLPHGLRSALEPLPSTTAERMDAAPMPDQLQRSSKFAGRMLVRD